MGSDWDDASPPQNLFLNKQYLAAVEMTPPKGIRFSYLVFYKKEKPVGVAYCQITNFSVEESIQPQSPDNTKSTKYPCVLRALGRFLKNLVVGKNHNLLVCGNLLLTGEHGFYFSPDVPKEEVVAAMEAALVKVQEHWQRKKVNIDGIFIKDLVESHRPLGVELTKSRFSEFTFHPNMVLEIPEAWQTFDDYLAAIASKYRVRVKRAFRLGEGIEKSEFSTAEVIARKAELFRLFGAVVSSQDFNMVNIDETYFPTLKKQLGDQFRVFGYHLNGELIGFYTTISNHDEMEAHFLGFDQALNRERQVYLNMLFDILKFAIQRGAKKVVYARTAMEIKSSVGAEPNEMYCYIRASNRITNTILPRAIEYLRPPADWVPRSPFKD